MTNTAFNPNGKTVLMALIMAFLLIAAATYGQKPASVSGRIINQADDDPISFATVALYHSPDSSLVDGVISKEDGWFLIQLVPAGKYYLKVSFVGYQTAILSLDLKQGEKYDTGNIPLTEKAVNIAETVVSAERIKAKTSNGKTTFFMNRKMHKVSNTGMDVLKHIPGIQFDFRQNISLAGKSNILILVNGRERDMHYIKQLNSEQIDKVEVIHSPGAKYPAEVNGVLNVVLKKKDSGLKGHVFAEIPGSKDEIYLFPSAGLNYGYKDLSIFASCDGEFSYFDIHKKRELQIGNQHAPIDFYTESQFRQKNWSHHMHYGIEYRLNKKNSLQFYGFYNPWSWEHDGSLTMKIEEGQTTAEKINGQREDTDRNHKHYYSLHYQHDFDENGKTLAVDLSYFTLNAFNKTTYNYTGVGNDFQPELINQNEPYEERGILRVEYNCQLGKKTGLEAGGKSVMKTLLNKQDAAFRYEEMLHSVYASVHSNLDDFRFKAGMRAEYLEQELTGEFNRSKLALLPHANLIFKLGKIQDISFSYRRSLERPGLYELNPTLSVINPFMMQQGNPALKPAIQNKLALEYSLRPNNNYLAATLFWENTSNVIDRMSFINNKQQLQIETANMGTMRQYGLQLIGSLKLTGQITLNPYLKGYRYNVSMNQAAMEKGLDDKSGWAYESGLSAMMSFKHDFSVSAIFSYNSPQPLMQCRIYEDAIYFLKVDKMIMKDLKIGIKAALPFAGSFVYRGKESQSDDFYHKEEGKIQMSPFPVWFQLKYQFSLGKKLKPNQHKPEGIYDTPKKGF
ncbi:MAG: TonB-dependent receptor family protein [Bacteroidales bacterium]|nr:TonB-dependent receptor family protein [Bacteroidales bacterium]